MCSDIAIPPSTPYCTCNIAKQYCSYRPSCSMVMSY